MDRPNSTLLTPPDSSEVLVLERVLLRLGQLTAILKTTEKPVRAALEGRGLIGAVCLMLTAAHQAQGEENPVAPLDLYCALYGVSLPDRPDWALSARARYLALRLDTVLQHGAAVRLGDWLRLPSALAPALPPADPASGVPRLYRAFEMLRLGSLQSRRQVECWGILPFTLAQVGLTPLPVPALTLTHQRLRLERFDAVSVRRKLLDQLDTALFELLALADRLVRDRALMKVRLASERKTEGLEQLANLLLKLPLVSPALLARTLHVNLPAAGRLCTRAAELGLLKPITTRSSWKVYGAALVQDRYGRRLGLDTKLQSTTRTAPAPVRKLLEDVDALLAAMDTAEL